MRKLTVAIPTYNGEQTIKIAIESIISQIVEQKLDACLLVSDNKSEDNTSVICAEYVKKYPDYFFYYCNEKNKGYDFNVHNCVEKAESEYVWHFSDNEVITDKYAVAKVIAYLEKHEVQFLFLNHENKIDVGETGKDYFEDSDEYFQTMKFKSGLISNCVVKRKTWMDLDMLRYDGCLWIHMAYQIEALSPLHENHSGGIIYEKFFEPQPAPQKWGANGTFIFQGFKLLEIFARMNELGYNKPTVKIADFCVIGGYPFNLLYARMLGLKITKDIREMFIKYCGKYPYFWFKVFPFLIIPIPKWAFTMAKKVKNLFLSVKGQKP